MHRSHTLVSLAVFLVFLLGSTESEARMSPRQIYKTKAPGVVLVVASPQGSSSASAGTGSIIRADGTVITNCHVIYDQENKAPFETVHVFLKPKRVTGNMNKDLRRNFAAEVIAFDQDLDLALVRLKKPPRNLTVLTLGDPGDLGPGDETVAIGHPEQGGLWTITTGVIGTQFEDFKGVPGKHVFQMETSLNRGNSGGPLFDVRGYQVGVNTAIARKGQGGVAITGVNFALKASVVKKWAAGHNVMLAYGGEPLVPPDTRVAAAEPSRPARERTRPEPPPADTGKTTYRDPESGGTITVEDDGDDQGREVERRPDEDTEQARRPFAGRTRPKRKPLRFKKRYRTRPRPYTYKRLFTAVDKVRARAEEAFDDLDREIMRRR